MKKMIENKKYRIIALISFLTTTFLIGIFFSKVIFTPVDVVEAIAEGTEYPESAFPNVARLFSEYGNDHCTGTLIDSSHVITAAHCFYDSNKNRQNVNSDEMRVRLNGAYYQSKAIYIHPNYRGYTLDGETDAAIIELDKNVTGITPAPLLTTKTPLHTEVTIAGYGLVSCGSDQDIPESSLVAPPLGKIYASTTEFDGFGWGVDYQNPNSNYVYWDFDTCGGNTTAGDSGGPAFYNNKLVAIASAGDRPSSTFGVESVNTRIDKIVPWINNVLAGKVKPTPDRIRKIEFQPYIPSPNDIVSGLVEVRVFITLEENAANLDFYIDDKLIESRDVQPERKPNGRLVGTNIEDYEFDSTKYSNGKHTLKFKAVDQYESGITGESELVPFIINNPIPPALCNNTAVDTFIFKEPIKIGSKDYCVDLAPHPNLDNSGRYDMDTWFGLYGDSASLGSGNLQLLNGNSVLKIRKQGSLDYVGQLKRVTGTVEYYSTAGINGNTVTIFKSDNNSSGSTSSKLYDPGGYVIEVWYNNQKISFDDVCLPSRTSPTGNKIGDVVCGEGANSGKVISGSSPSDLTINETETITFIAADQQQFSGTSTKYDEISMNGSLTPLIEGDDLSIDGSLTYSYKTVPVNDINKGGKISVQLVDNDGNKSKIVPMNVVPAGETTDYNKPYFFNPTFDNYRRFLGENGKPVTADRKGPFTLNITDDVLGIKIIDIPVVDVVISGDMEAFNEGGGMAPESENTNPSDTLNDPASQNNVNNPSDGVETKKGLLRNPLRKGLDSIPEIVSALVKNIVIPIAVPFLALSIIYTGFLFIQARGNKEKLVKAKEALKWTLIGGAIILASYVIATALQGTIADIIR